MDLSKIYPPRPDWVHKGNFGNVLVVAGSKLYSGSAALAAQAALRSGADLVTVAACERSANIAAGSLVDLITYPLKGNYLTGRHVNEILDLAHVRKVNAAVVGCGLGRHPSTIEAINKLIQKLTVPMVIDADGLLAISHKPEIVHRKHTVLTPHAGELAILLDLGQVEGDFESRLKFTKLAATKYQSVVLLKGHVDIVTDGSSTITNNAGTPLMTKGGFGDSLSGILGALLARGLGLLESAHAAAYINGKAGEMAAVERGEGLVASDIFEFIPKVIRQGSGDSS